MNVKTWLDSLKVPMKPDEWEVKQLLSMAGFEVPRGWRLVDGALPDVPSDGEFAVKVCSPDILHKTDRGGVMLGTNAAELDSAVSEMRRRFPGSPVLVEEMVRDRGVEMILGMIRDPEVGPAIMLGWGGVYTEVLGDAAFRLPPLTPADVHDMLESLMVSKLLDFRGFKADREALVRAVVRFSEMVAELGDSIREMDINPMLVTSSGPLVLDAKMILA